MNRFLVKFLAGAAVAVIVGFLVLVTMLTAMVIYM